MQPAIRASRQAKSDAAACARRDGQRQAPPIRPALANSSASARPPAARPRRRTPPTPPRFRRTGSGQARAPSRLPHFDPQRRRVALERAQAICVAPLAGRRVDPRFVTGARALARLQREQPAPASDRRFRPTRARRPGTEAGLGPLVGAGPRAATPTNAAPAARPARDAAAPAPRRRLRARRRFRPIGINRPEAAMRRHVAHANSHALFGLSPRRA